jgi:Ni/Fe-hydrogenase 1 B-type cytochrome subunit
VFVVTFFLRIAWGFFGNAYARWSDIIPLNREKWVLARNGLKWYLNGFKTKVKPVVGHDPLAAVFYTLLFLVFVWQTASGLALSGIEFGTFPGSILVSIIGQGAAKGLKHSIEETHEFGMFVVIIFFVMHIAGLVAHEVKGKKGLFSSMISGRKFFKTGE